MILRRSLLLSNTTSSNTTSLNSDCLPDVEGCWEQTRHLCVEMRFRFMWAYMMIYMIVVFVYITIFLYTCTHMHASIVHTCMYSHTSWTLWYDSCKSVCQNHATANVQTPTSKVILLGRVAMRPCPPRQTMEATSHGISLRPCLSCLGTCCDARLRLPLAAHRTPSTQASWCTFDRGGVQDEWRACRA